MCYGLWALARLWLRSPPVEVGVLSPRSWSPKRPGIAPDSTERVDPPWTCYVETEEFPNFKNHKRKKSQKIFIQFLIFLFACLVVHSSSANQMQTKFKKKNTWKSKKKKSSPLSQAKNLSLKRRFFNGVITPIFTPDQKPAFLLTPIRPLLMQSDLQSVGKGAIDTFARAFVREMCETVCSSPQNNLKALLLHLSRAGSVFSGCPVARNHLRSVFDPIGSNTITIIVFSNPVGDCNHRVWPRWIGKASEVITRKLAPGKAGNGAR